MKRSMDEQLIKKDLSLDYSQARKKFKDISISEISEALLYNEEALIEYIKENYDKIISIKINGEEEIEKYRVYPRLYSQLKHYRKYRSELRPVEILILKINAGKIQKANRLHKQRIEKYPEFAEFLEASTTKYNFIVSAFGSSTLRQENKSVIDIIKKHLPIDIF